MPACSLILTCPCAWPRPPLCRNTRLLLPQYLFGGVWLRWQADSNTRHTAMKVSYAISSTIKDWTTEHQKLRKQHQVRCCLSISLRMVGRCLHCFLSMGVLCGMQFGPTFPSSARDVLPWNVVVQARPASCCRLAAFART